MVAKQLLSVGYGRFPGFERYACLFRILSTYKDFLQNNSTFTENSISYFERDKLSKKQLARKMGLCREVMKVSELVETGIATKIGTY